jgi:hypothetical protein
VVKSVYSETIVTIVLKSLLLNGQRINDSDAPQVLGLKDNDVIQVYVWNIDLNKNFQKLFPLNLYRVF